MSNQYKHKKTGKIANRIYDETGAIYNYVIIDVRDIKFPPELVEDSCDWELIEEKMNPFVTRDQVTVTSPYQILYTCFEDGAYPDSHYAMHQKGSNKVAFSSVSARDTYIKEVNKPNVILTTEDGVNITDPEQTLSDVRVSDWLPGWGQAKVYRKGNSYKVFSTSQARDEYILNNKPLLSVKEIWDLIRSTQRTGRYLEAIKSLAKSKL